MADPLTLLQEYTTGKRGLRELKHNGTLYYVFDDAAYPHDSKTNLSVYNKPDEFYSIESILNFWRMREMQHTAYVRDVSGKGIASITRVQRRDLIDFLRGGALPKEANMLAPIPPPIPASRLQDERNQLEPPEKKKPRLEQEKKGQRIDKILDMSTDGSDQPEVRGLSNELPAEKVAQLRTLVKKNLKNKPLDDESFVPLSDLAMPDASNDAVGKFITEKERLRKDRTTCLESQSRDFSCVLTALKDIQVRENQAKSHPQHDFSLSSQSQSSRVQKSLIPGGYSRYDQEIFQKETVADFEIETDLSFHGNAALNQRIGAAHPQNRPTALTSNGVQRSDPRRPITTGVAPSAMRQQHGPGQKRVSRVPIIIIPAGASSLITIYNAQEILQDLRYVSTEEKKQFSSKRENELLLQIPKNGVTVPYRVVDNPTRLKDEEWDRVVAVFVQGPAWQFKNWKWNGNPVEIFANIAAFHLQFDELPTDPNVKKWSVHVLKLSRTKRHLDRAELHKFWEMLDRHISKSNKREWLRY
ncbi:hypothetical protein niasHT_013551 [Heterodera trifolii]|uniref:Parafibromin n=1 Tax=Heterodera trifolii TaxID=157864 RepID=A0ABD2LEC8_9BILA